MFQNHPEGKENDKDSGITRKAREEEEELIKKLMRTDLDDTPRIGETKKPTTSVNISDNQSVASSLTLNSVESNMSIESNMSVDDFSKIISMGTTNFQHLFSTEELQSLTQKEIVERINQWFQHTQNKSSTLTEVSKDNTPIKQNQKKSISGSASKPSPTEKNSSKNYPSMPASSNNTGNQK